MERWLCLGHIILNIIRTFLHSFGEKITVSTAASLPGSDGMVIYFPAVNKAPC